MSKQTYHSYHKEYRRNNEEFKIKNRAWRNEYTKRRKAIVLEHYGARCACCGEDKYTFLTLDHVNNDGHKDITAAGYRFTGTHLYNRIIKENFPNTFQVLCMNCNFSKRMNGGICEHVS